eukprot:s4375_g2.t1
MDETGDGQLVDSQDDLFGPSNVDFSFVEDLMRNDNTQLEFSRHVDEAGESLGLDRHADSLFSPTTAASVEFAAGESGADQFESTGGMASSSHEGLGQPVDFDKALNSAFMSVSAERPQQVWETGIWRHIFGDDSDTLDFDVWGSQLKRPLPSSWGVDAETLVLPSAVGAKKRFGLGCNYMDVVSFKQDVPWQEQRDADLQRGLNMWLAITSRWSDECSFTIKLDEMRSEDERVNMFAHLFAGRAPVTVRKRGAAILKLCDYLESERQPPFPISELAFYRFLCSESMQGAPKSRLMGFVQALTFCRHVLDVVELQPVLDSKRCKGAAHDDNPRERRQASPLSVQELVKLHTIVEEATDGWDALFAGAALLCCYCRGRWGDLMRSERAFMDFDESGKPAFLETRTGRHKTMSAQMHRHQFLPMVSPVKGVSGTDWATPWVNLRKSLGISFPPEGLIMPAPDRHGNPTERPLESGECGKWLRRLLDLETCTGPTAERRVSSHSLKATMLSFAAKRGFSVPDRLLLGYHASNMQMSLVYSRDGAAASLLLLEQLIDEIVKGKFKPDSTRSGRIVDVPDKSPEPQPRDVKVEVIESSEDEINGDEELADSSDSTSSSDSSGSDIPQDHSLNKVFAPPTAPRGHTRWQHSKLKTVHLTAEGYSKVFVCGRPVGNFHHPVEQNPRFDSPICWACFNKANKSEQGK